jgi:hypothetical protein
MSGCGCKNKPVESQPSPAQIQTPQQQQTETVQESVKKVVEKYYKK